ncbi:MAG: hypothetical protein AAGJ10_05620 [Bacteroidota bacterium]
MAFTAKQVQRILQRATEVERAEARTSATTGLSAAEVQALGVEAGLSKASMRQALRELEAPAPTGRLTDTAAHFRTALFPTALTPAMGDALLNKLRRQFGRPGSVYHIGDGFEWHSTHKGSLVVCSVRPEGDQLRISLQVSSKRLLSESSELWFPLLAFPVIGILGGFIDLGMSAVVFMSIASGILLGTLFVALYVHDTITTGAAERSIRDAFNGFNALPFDTRRTGDV